jgi:hypothetical protein
VESDEEAEDEVVDEDYVLHDSSTSESEENPDDFPEGEYGHSNEQSPEPSKAKEGSAEEEEHQDGHQSRSGDLLPGEDKEFAGFSDSEYEDPAPVRKHPRGNFA